MAIRRGASTPSAIYRGATAVQKVMRGTVEVWSATALGASQPDHWYPLDYTSAPYINRGTKVTPQMSFVSGTFASRTDHAFVNGAQSSLVVAEPWGSSYTMAGWFERTSASSALNYFFSRGGTSVGTGSLLFVAAGATSTTLQWRVASQGNLSSWMSQTGVLPTSGWFHLAVTSEWTGSQNRLRFYVNGVNVRTSDLATQYTQMQFSSDTAVTVGNSTSGGYPWTGNVDDPAIWSRTLSDAEIAAIYADGRST